MPPPRRRSAAAVRPSAERPAPAARPPTRTISTVTPGAATAPAVGALSGATATRAALLLCDRQAASKAAEAAAAADLATRSAEGLGSENAREARAVALAEVVDAAERDLEQASAALVPLEKDAPDQEAASATLRRARAALDQDTEMRQRLDTDLARLRGEIGVQAEEAIEERHAEVAGRLAAASDRKARLEAEVPVARGDGNGLDYIYCGTIVRDAWFPEPRLEAPSGRC